MVTKLKVRWVSLRFWHFWLFLVHFVLRISKSKELSDIFIWIFNYHTFLKYEVIAFVTTGVEHTVMCTLLHAYAYLHENWFIFSFQIAAMSIIGCDNVHYWDSLLITHILDIYIFIYFIWFAILYSFTHNLFLVILQVNSFCWRVNIYLYMK